MTRRAEDLAVTLGDILPRVPYRHVVITFPRLMGIRHRVREDPTLLRRLVRLSVGVVTRELRREVRAHRHRREELAAALPGVVAACQSAGDCLQYHPHIHALITDGVFLPSGDFYGYLDWDSGRLTGLLRDSVLASFTRLGLLSPEAADTMKSWPVERSGFHVHVETRVDPDDREHLRTLLKYLTRSPIALDRLNYSEQTGQVTYRTKKGATLHTLERGRTGRVDLRRRCFARNAAASAPDSGPVPPLWGPSISWQTCLSMSPREGAPSCRTTAGSPAPWADWSDEASPSPKGLPPHPHPGDALPGPGSSSASGRWTRRSALGAGPRCVAVGPCWSGTSWSASWPIYASEATRPDRLPLLYPRPPR